MTATTGPGTYPWKYQAWCDQCQDGRNSLTRNVADKWATKHNHKRHRDEQRGESNSVV